MRVVKLNDAISYSEPQIHGCRPILGIIECGGDVGFVDCGASPKHREEFRSYISHKNTYGSEYTFLTHGHWDHYAGGKGKSTLIASASAAEAIERQRKEIKSGFSINGIIAEYGCEKIPECVLEKTAPDIIVSDEKERYTQFVGNLEVILHRIDSDHCNGNLVIEIPKYRVAFIGDCIYSNTDNNKCYYSSRILDVLEYLYELDVAVYLPSHSEPLSKDTIECRISKYKEICGYTQDIFSLMDLKRRLIRSNGILPDKSVLDEYAWFVEGNRRRCLHEGK